MIKRRQKSDKVKSKNDLKKKDIDQITPDCTTMCPRARVWIYCNYSTNKFAVLFINWFFFKCIFNPLSVFFFFFLEACCSSDLHLCIVNWKHLNWRQNIDNMQTAGRKTSFYGKRAALKKKSQSESTTLSSLFSVLFLLLRAFSKSAPCSLHF